MYSDYAKHYVYTYTDTYVSVCVYGNFLFPQDTDNTAGEISIKHP